VNDGLEWVTATLTEQALRLAMAAHKGQVDKLGVDYIEHVKAVASAVRHFGADYEITALLHDSIEDCQDRSLVSFMIIRNKFGNEIATAIDCITKRCGEDYEKGYLSRVRNNKIAKEVKKADVQHNLSRIDLLDDIEMKERLRAKYSKVISGLL